MLSKNSVATKNEEESDLKGGQSSVQKGPLKRPTEGTFNIKNKSLQKGSDARKSAQNKLLP